VDIPRTMRAAVLFGPREFRIVDKPVPLPAEGEVLVKIAMCGMCGTDLKIQEHPFPGQPPYGQFTPGHEWTGTVVQLGAGVDELRIGDRVAIEAHKGCGRCANCITGRYGLDVAGGFIAGESIVVIGPGPVGLMTVQVCAALGAGQVILVGTRAARLELGRRLGAQAVINARDEDPVAAVKRLVGGAGADLVIEASGAPEAPQQTVEMVRRAGR